VRNDAKSILPEGIEALRIVHDAGLVFH
jgi:hypothetical protein